MLGIYLSGHPLSEVKDLVARASSTTAGDIRESSEGESKEIRDQQKVRLAGIISGVTTKITKNNRQMAFIKLEDLTSAVEVIAFPKVYEKVVPMIKSDKLIIVTGRVQFKEDEEPKIIADELQALEEENIPNKNIKKPSSLPEKRVETKQKKVFIKIEKVESQVVDQLLKILSDYPGRTPVVIYAEKEKRKMAVKSSYFVTPSDTLIKSLEAIAGKGAVIFQ
jgi:DNA polymerase-3 subunit alpha